MDAIEALEYIWSFFRLYQSQQRELQSLAREFRIGGKLDLVWNKPLLLLFDSKPMLLLFEVQTGSIINCKCIVYQAGLNSKKPLVWTSTALGKVSHCYCRLKSKTHSFHVNDTGTFTVLHDKLSKGAMSILRNRLQEGCFAHFLD